MRDRRPRPRLSPFFPHIVYSPISFSSFNPLSNSIRSPTLFNRTFPSHIFCGLNSINSSLFACGFAILSPLPFPKGKMLSAHGFTRGFRVSSVHHIHFWVLDAHFWVPFREGAKKEGPLDPQYGGGDERSRSDEGAPRRRDGSRAKKKLDGKLKRMEWRGKGMAISIKKRGKIKNGFTAF